LSGAVDGKDFDASLAALPTDRRIVIRLDEGKPAMGNGETP